MRIHFFAAPFWLLSFGSGFRVQGSGGGFAAFFRRWYSRIAAFPDGEGLGGATLRVDFYKGRCPKVVGIAIRGKRISNIRGEPTPSRYAGQPLPEEGARMWGVLSVSIPPSFGRRCSQGGGWRRRAE